MPQQGSSIQRTSSGSLLPFAPPTPGPSVQRKKWPPEDEIIPDSEEERLNEKRAQQGATTGSRVSTSDEDSDIQVVSVSPTKRARISQQSVIIISSGSEEEGDIVKHARGLTKGSDDPFLTQSISHTTNLRHRDKGKSKARPPEPRIEHDSDSSIICISDTESDPYPPPTSISPVKERILQRTLTPYTPVLDRHDPDIASDDSAILTHDPPVRAKPILRTPGTKSKPKASSKTKAAPGDVVPAPVTPRKPKAVPPEQLRLQEYARTLFVELNTVVFGGGIPPTTELIWNVRLATTAGRAFWSSNRHGETSSKIELSPKVVDSDERVRFTLAHEMCHLAVWVLDGDPNEQGHGRQFKAWAARVMKARPDITINTKHTYEINFKFNWECSSCGWKYGRHSKSIDPSKMGCAMCEPPGRLKPLFETRPPRTPKAASKSKLASGSPRESPRAMDRSPRVSTKLANPTLADEDEVEELIKGLGDINI